MKIEKKSEDFQVTAYVTKSTSYGIIDKQDGVELDVTLEMDFDEQYGWFEVYDVETGGDDWYASGGIWVKGNKVVDYDGVFSLSDFIISKLEEWGYDVSDL
jgi:hypothetical protein